MRDDPGVGDYEDVAIYTLSDEREQLLFSKQTECTFMWTNKAGEPVGVIMNYVHRDGSFWLTATRQRARVPAIERDPRVAVAISSRGTDIGVSQSVTYKGRAVVHDDAATKAWFYPALAAFLRPGDADKQRAFVDHLDSPGRVVIEVRPTMRIGFDSEAMFRDSSVGPSATEV
jgi:general stress protein 26